MSVKTDRVYFSIQIRVDEKHRCEKMNTYITT